MDFKKLKEKDKGKKKAEKEKAKQKEEEELKIKENNEKRYKDLLKRIVDTLTQNNPDLCNCFINSSRKYQDHAETARCGQRGQQEDSHKEFQDIMQAAQQASWARDELLPGGFGKQLWINR